MNELKKLKARRDHWRELADKYVEHSKKKYEYKVKESRGMTEGVYKCPICNGEHEIDEYNWVLSCIGYIGMNNIKYMEEEWKEERKKHGKIK